MRVMTRHRVRHLPVNDSRTGTREQKAVGGATGNGPTATASLPASRLPQEPTATTITGSASARCRSGVVGFGVNGSLVIGSSNGTAVAVRVCHLERQQRRRRLVGAVAVLRDRRDRRCVRVLDGAVDAAAAVRQLQRRRCLNGAATAVTTILRSLRQRWRVNHDRFWLGLSYRAYATV
jgi:hypothetical protein